MSQKNPKFLHKSITETPKKQWQIILHFFVFFWHPSRWNAFFSRDELQQKSDFLYTTVLRKNVKNNKKSYPFFRSFLASFLVKLNFSLKAGFPKFTVVRHDWKLRFTKKDAKKLPKKRVWFVIVFYTFL